MHIGEAREGGPHPVAQIAALDQALDARLVRQVAEDAFGLLRARLRAASTQLHQAAVAQNRLQPAGDGRRVAQLGQSRQSGQERIVDRVLGFATAADERQGGRVKMGAVALEKEPERLRLPPQRR